MEALTFREIKSRLKAHSEAFSRYQVKRIGLFGSYSGGKPRKNSDLDFLVEFEKPTFDNFMDLSFFLEKLFKKKVDLITPLGLSPHLKPYVEKEVKWL